MPKVCWIFLCLVLASSGCTSHQAAFSLGKYKEHSTDPQKVAFYTEESSIQRPYRVLGLSSVSQRNFIGFKREPQAVKDIMQKVAASVGGDAIVNIKQDNSSVQGTIISYEKALS